MNNNLLEKWQNYNNDDRERSEMAPTSTKEVDVDVEE